MRIDSDNGGEFINRQLYAYCQQKNWSAVHRLIGYDRYKSQGALEQLKRLYTLLGRYVNFFQPTIQRQEKKCHVARVHKVYDAARTPYQRLLDHSVLSQDQRDRLAAECSRLNPARLLRQMRKERERL